MTSFFYNMGKKVGPKVRKGKWLWHSLTGTEADAIAAELAVGKDLALEIIRQTGVDRDPKVKNLLDKLSSRLTPCVANKLRTFHFDAIGSGPPNAFALPGGFVFITHSLLDLCKHNPDEIAFILAHEMAHVIRGHAMERIITATAISAASRTAPAPGALKKWLQHAGLKVIESAYSQDRELEADTLGFRLITAADCDRSAPVKMLTRLKNLNQTENQPLLAEYFSSHPQFNQRIQNINSLLHPKKGTRYLLVH